ncbi:hypothetical protein ACN6LA_006294 [Streptomyces sp. SAS_269]|uniref:hypothetical protein n=1 Tax=Streptomyces sp. SAS_269 TaxID=3412749 RepID=UPI00403CFA6F
MGDRVRPFAAGQGEQSEDHPGVGGEVGHVAGLVDERAAPIGQSGPAAGRPVEDEGAAAAGVLGVDGAAARGQIDALGEQGTRLLVVAEPHHRVRRVAQAAGGLLPAADEVAVAGQALDEPPGGRVTTVEQDAHVVRGDGGLNHGVSRLVRDGHGPLAPDDVLGERRVRSVRHGERRHRPGHRRRPVLQLVDGAGEFVPAFDDQAHLVALQESEVQTDLTAHGKGQARVGDDVPENLQRLVGAHAHHRAAGEQHGEPGAGLLGDRGGRQRRLQKAHGTLLLAGVLVLLCGAFHSVQPAPFVAAGAAMAGHAFPRDGMASGEQARGPSVQYLANGPGRRAPDGGGSEG